jgi:Family of unknown function (DUF6011)
MTLTDIFAGLDVDPRLDAGAVKDNAAKDDVAGRLTTAEAALRFMRGGRATVTLRSKRTDTWFTYRIGVPATVTDGTLFVGILTGSDNTRDYRYLGRIAGATGLFWAGRKAPKPGDVSPDAPSAKAFAWAWKKLLLGELPEQLEVWHEGFCAKCGRKLTVPESIESGFGPECVNHV